MTFQIAMVCLGNICRSPMAHVVLERKLSESGLDDRVSVVSAGTGGWHTGEPMDERAAKVLGGIGYDPAHHRARRFTQDWYAENDLLLAMDESNYADMKQLSPTVSELSKLRMFRSFDPESTKHDAEVPDPWFGGIEGFHQVLATVERTCDAIVVALPELLRSKAAQ